MAVNQTRRHASLLDATVTFLRRSYPTPLPPARLVGRLLVAMVLAFLASQASAARDDVLQVFWEEFVELTPGEGKFPAAKDLPANFSVARYEVTQQLYASIMGSNPSRWRGPRNSAEMMTWNEAMTFCQRATSQLRARKLLGPQEEIRLPTEREWEYACRAGTTTAYSFGDSAQADGDVGTKATLLDQYGWHTGNAAGNDPAVGVLAANPWGFCDMHGYLWEMTRDDWRPTADAAADPQSVALRGGSWQDGFGQCQSDSRRAAKKTHKSDAIGFRCVRAAVTAK